MVLCDFFTKKTYAAKLTLLIEVWFPILNRRLKLQKNTIMTK